MEHEQKNRLLSIDRKAIGASNTPMTRHDCNLKNSLMQLVYFRTRLINTNVVTCFRGGHCMAAPSNSLQIIASLRPQAVTDELPELLPRPI